MSDQKAKTYPKGKTINDKYMPCILTYWAACVLSVFHVDKNDDIEANVLRYSEKDSNYYLRVYKKGRVKLRVSEKLNIHPLHLRIM